MLAAETINDIVCNKQKFFFEAIYTVFFKFLAGIVE